MNRNSHKAVGCRLCSLKLFKGFRSLFATGKELRSRSTFYIGLFCLPMMSIGQMTEGTYNLIDAEMDTVLVQINDGMIWNLADIGSLNLQAVNSYTVDQVVFEVSYQGSVIHTQSEGVAPYAAFVDISGDYEIWQPVKGTYTFEVDYNLNGTLQGTDVFTITFINIPYGSIWDEDNGTANYSGEVAIGTTAVPSGFKMAVNGKLIAEEVQVQLNGSWPDYVFLDYYDLLSLGELKEYIRKHGHLPKVPSAEEVRAEGLSLGDMDKLLLEKVEELTLYLIQQQDVLLRQQNQIEALQKLLDQKD
ncbi:hypothetical protein LDL77_19115 [Flagellimonas marinaquae]|uniref:hypothetical protein n=1 Tax=Flagellimonas aurea TaxID=2915619 RepID=UPI001CE15CCB|nr:hypothetical protein LDL77_19115 [Allomuricauda aquimarina]